MAKEPQELKWIESLLPEGDYRRKGMFGGFTYYIDERMFLAIFESPGNTSYQGKKYPFEIWNGCMFPVDHEHHAKALQQFPYLVSHPILPKWLYLPLHSEGFDELVSDVIEQAMKPRGFWGTYPKSKTKKPANAKPISLDKISTKIDTRKPKMFADEPIQVRLQQVEKISDLKNLGPTAEAQFQKAGIKNAQQFIKMGWQKALVKLVKVNPKNKHTMYAYALVGALTNKEWNRLTEEEKLEAKTFTRSIPVDKKTKKSKAKK